MKRVAVAVSGGMDSLYAMLSLKRRGCDVLALHARLLSGAGRDKPLAPESEAPGVTLAGAILTGVTLTGVPVAVDDKLPVSEAEEALAALCRSLDVPLYFADLRKEFDRLVITPFVEAWGRGETPNPCALCNPRIKFGLLQDYAFALGAESLATGHYARLLDYSSALQGLPGAAVVKTGADGAERVLRGKKVLAAGIDRNKDQSYFLSLVPPDRLAKAMFPLGGKLKSEIRAQLAAEGFAAPVSTESQEICFIADDDYKTFLRERLGGGQQLEALLGGPGLIVQASSGRELGRHQGLWQYTQGQRRGLGVPFSEPLYVTGKDLARNRLLVDVKAAQGCAGVRTLAANVLLEPEDFAALLQTGPLWVKTRYRQKAVPARARQLEDGGLHIEFTGPPEWTASQSREAAAPGQVAVLYAALPGEEGKAEGFYVAAAGVIAEALS